MTPWLEKVHAWFWGLEAVPDHASDATTIVDGDDRSTAANTTAGQATVALEWPILVPEPLPVCTPDVGETAILLLDAAGVLRHEIHSHTLILDDPPGPTLSHSGVIYAFVSGADRVYTYQAVA